MTLIQAITAILNGVPGINQVVDNGLEVPKSSPAAAVELAAERTQEPEELGGGLLSLVVILSVAVSVKFVGSNPSNARQQVANLARAVRKALVADHTLGGACETSTVLPTEYGYLLRGGENYAVATLLVEAQTEEAL